MLARRRTREPMQALIIELGETGTASKVVLNGVKPRISRCVITMSPARRPRVELTLLPTMVDGNLAPQPTRMIRGELFLPERQPVMIVGRFAAADTDHSDDWPSTDERPETTVDDERAQPALTPRRRRRWAWLRAMIGASC